MSQAPAGQASPQRPRSERPRKGRVRTPVIGAVGAHGHRHRSRFQGRLLLACAGFVFAGGLPSLRVWASVFHPPPRPPSPSPSPDPAVTVGTACHQVISDGGACLDLPASRDRSEPVVAAEAVHPLVGTAAALARPPLRPGVLLVKDQDSLAQRVRLNRCILQSVCFVIKPVRVGQM